MDIKYGDRVSHETLGKGKAGNSYRPDWVVVYFDLNTDSARFGTDVHMSTITKIIPKTFEARVVWTGGAVTLSGAMTKGDLKRYMGALDMEDMDEYTVTRIKSREERIADYMVGMTAEDDALEGK